MAKITKLLNKKNILIVQSNKLVEAYYDTDLTATEHKILRYAAGKIRGNPEGFPSVTFTVREFLEAGGIKGDGYYSRFEKIADDLSVKRIKIQAEGTKGWVLWLSALLYNEGEVELTFNPMLKSMLLGLDEQFTKYDYKYIGDMRSSYTIRLFELMKQYAPIGKRKVQLDVLRNMLGTGDKYKKYAQFKLRVLLQAQRELEEKGEITFDFNEIKKGRKVVAIEFIIKTSKKTPMRLVTPEIGVETFVKEAELLLDIYSIKIPKERIKTWDRFGIDLLNEALKGLKGKEINNYPAYIEKILESKHEDYQVEKETVKTDDNKYAGLVASFIRENKSKEIIPAFHIKALFIAHVKDHISDKEDVKQLWKDNEEHISRGVSLYLN